MLTPVQMFQHFLPCNVPQTSPIHGGLANGSAVNTLEADTRAKFSGSRGVTTMGQAYFGSKISADVRIWFYYRFQYMTLKAAVLCARIQIVVNVLPGIVI